MRAGVWGHACHLFLPSHGAFSLPTRTASWDRGLYCGPSSSVTTLASDRTTLHTWPVLPRYRPLPYHTFHLLLPLRRLAPSALALRSPLRSALPLQPRSRAIALPVPPPRCLPFRLPTRCLRTTFARSLPATDLPFTYRSCHSAFPAYSHHTCRWAGMTLPPLRQHITYTHHHPTSGTLHYTHTPFCPIHACISASYGTHSIGL